MKIDPILKQVLAAANLDAVQLYNRMSEGQYRPIDEMPAIMKLGTIAKLSIQREGDTLMMPELNAYDNVSCIEIMMVEVADKFYDKNSSDPFLGGTKFKHDIVFGVSNGRGLPLDQKIHDAINTEKSALEAEYIGKTLSSLRTLPAFLPDVVIKEINPCGFLDITSDFEFVDYQAAPALKAA